MRTRQTVTHLPVDLIDPSPSPVRERLGNLDELVATMREHGMLTPLLVTEHPDRRGRFQLIAGRRRLAAACVSGLNTVPAIVRHGLGGNRVEELLVTLAEDASDPLGPQTRGHIVCALLNAGLTVPDVVRRTGLEPATLTWLLSLLEVDDLASLDADTAAELSLATTPAHRDVEASHFNAQHPLAPDAQRRCRHRRETRIGGVACGECWERTLVVHATTAPVEPEVNPTAVARAVDGHGEVDLNPAEKVEAIRILTGRALTAREIAERLNVSTKTVYRARTALATRPAV